LGYCVSKGSSNRTIVGLKRTGFRIHYRLNHSSNRTIVGLKPIFADFMHRGQKGSNRTIVGLKRSYLVSPFLNLYRQQSHHCGIETFSAQF